MRLEAANREVYLLLKEGIKVSVPESDSTPGKGHTSSRQRPPSPQGGEGNRGGQKAERLRVIDWEQPANDANSDLRISTVERCEFRMTNFACQTD